MKFKISYSVLCILLFSTILLAETNSLFVRHPDVNSDGSKIVFSFQGDIWTVPTIGGKAARLTIHQAYEAWPKWSSDNKTIAFSSKRFGNYDIFTIPSNGGTPKRITYHSASDILNDFSADDDLLFTTARTFRQIEWEHEFGIVSSDGGTPELMIDALGEMPVKSPDGKFIAFSKGWGRVDRVAYRGSANFDIWIYNTQNKTYTKITNFDGHDIYPRWTDSRTLYFSSSRSGKYNIYKMQIGNDAKAIGEIEQITDFDENSIRYFNISNDGNTIVFEKETNIYTLSLNNNSVNKVNIDINSDYRFDPVISKKYSNNASEYAVSPNGKYSAFVVRGEVFLKQNEKKKSKSVNLTNNPYRDQNITWLNDSSLVFISDRDGQKDIYLVKSSDQDESNLFKSLKHETIRLTNTPEDESFPIISPSLDMIVYELGRGKLIVAKIDSLGEMSDEETLLDGWALPGNVTWSPDSKWVAYSLSDLSFNDEVYIQPIDKHIDPVNISMHPRYDGNPIWSKDGSKLGFVSKRSNSDYDVWFAWLNKDDWEKTRDDWEEDETPKPKKDKKKKDKDSKKVKPIKIDVENIYERLSQVTHLSGNESNIEISKDGETFYFTTISPTKKGRDLYSIKWNRKDIKELTKSGGNPSMVKLSNDGKHLYYLKRGSLNRLDVKSAKNESLSFSAKMKINYPVEKAQKFDEGWRALRDGFYDPNFHGQDWDELKEKYRPWCLSASTDNDFQYMYNVMLGELNASHMGMLGVKYREETQSEKTGFLGIRVKQNDDEIVINHVIKNSPASKERSKLKVNDIILSVNGNKISDNTNFYSLLTNTTSEKVLLEIKRNNKVEEVVIRPTRSLRNLLYNEWVDSKRKLVDKLSNGKLGYLHIKSMGIPSFERFEREFTARALGKEAIVIDVRFNGGGWTTDYLMTVLNYKQHAYTIPRGASDNLSKDKLKFRNNYPIGERLPFAAWLKPSIALCNQNSYSNAEIFSHAYKHLGIGKLVGTPTFGAVISTGSQDLIDNSYVRMPSRGWYVKATDKNMDLHPAVPDIIVQNEPNAKSIGKDAQLKKAVEELMKEIK